jgi:hypothetical protein
MAASILGGIWPFAHGALNHKPQAGGFGGVDFVPALSRKIFFAPFYSSEGPAFISSALLPALILVIYRKLTVS